MRRLLIGLAATLALAAALWLQAGPADGRVRTPQELALAAALPPGREAPVASVRVARPASVTAAVRSSGGAEEAASNPLEAQVVHAWQQARSGHAAEADAVLDQVLARAPQFRPALMLQGLLAAEWSQPARDADQEQAPERLLQPPSALADESGLRLNAWQQQTALRRLLPRNLLQVGQHVDTVLAADLAESRLYVLRRDARGFALRGDYYLSTGMRGSFKQNPGDQRTPIGVYSLLPRLPASQLPALAGHGAWPLSFPNRWDLWQGHLGSGIWLHGSAPGQYDGLPHSTNGCLALSNDDLDRIAPLLAERSTVLLVADHLEWISPAVLAQHRSAALQRLQLRTGAARRPLPEDSVYAYPGEPSVLLVRRAEGSAAGRDEFWPAGALEPLSALRASLDSGRAHRRL